MNIGVVVDNDLDSDKRVLREINILAKEGYNISVLCYGFKEKSYTDRYSFHVKRIAISKRIKNLLFFLSNLIPVYEFLWTRQIRQFVSYTRTDILHVHDLYMAGPASKAIRSSPLKPFMILDLHENFPFAIMTYNWTRGVFRSALSRPGMWKKKERKYLKYADRIVVLSEDFRDDLHKRYPELLPERFTVLPNVPDSTEGSFDKSRVFSPPFEKKAPVILYFGIVAERRGVFESLDVFSDLVAEGHPAVFLIIGPIDKADRKRFLKATSRKELYKKVHYIPWIDVADLPFYLEFSDICLAPFIKNPQHESGVANKIFDYMLGGKPIVASDCRPQQRVIQKHHCGLVYNSKPEFKRALITLLKDSDLRQKMGENGHNAVLKYYSTDITGNTLRGLYGSIKTLRKV